mgnify:CR=1 FL=1
MSRIASKTAALTVLTLACVGSATAQTPPAKKIYCWDEGGRRVCGDALPASAANSARVEYSARTGLATGEVGRALTASERAEAVAAAKLAEQRALEAKAQERRDLAMVESYRTENDLRQAYGERTGLLDESITSSKLGISNLRLSLISLLHQAGDKELAGTPVPATLTASIRDQHAELLHQQQVLISQQADRASLESEMQDTLRRYRESRAQMDAANADGTAPAPPPSTPPAATPPAPAAAAKPATR